MSPDDQARRMVHIAKGGIDIAGIDERILVPNIAERIRDLESDNNRMKRVMYDAAHLAATLGSGSQGWLRGRFMSISNALSMAIGRGQSSHGDQYDDAGNIIKSDELESYEHKR